MSNVIVLDDEQARVLTEARGTVELRDRRGKALEKVQAGHIGESGFTEEDVAIATQRAASDDPRYTTDAVLAYLHSLDAKPAVQPGDAS